MRLPLGFQTTPARSRVGTGRTVSRGGVACHGSGDEDQLALRASTLQIGVCRVRVAESQVPLREMTGGPTRSMTGSGLLHRGACSASVELRRARRGLARDRVARDRPDRRAEVATRAADGTGEGDVEDAALHGDLGDAVELEGADDVEEDVGRPVPPLFTVNCPASEMPGITMLATFWPAYGFIALTPARASPGRPDRQRGLSRRGHCGEVARQRRRPRRAHGGGRRPCPWPWAVEGCEAEPRA